MTDTDRELRHMLVRAATLEADRQAARQRQDWPAVAGIECELAALWRQYSDLEQQAERVA